MSNPALLSVSRSILSLAFVLVLGCGGGGTVSPPAPPPPPPPPPGPAPVASVTLDQSTVTLIPQATAQLAATLRDAAGNVLTGRTITWESNPAAVATVSSAGLVTGVLPGTAAVTAASEGRTASATITVREGAVVNPGGGTVTAAGGNAAVTIPAAALATAVPISIAAVSSPPAGAGLVGGTAYDFGPSGTTFAQPVTIALRYDAASAVGADPTRFRLHRHSGTAWTEVAGSSVDVGTRTVTGQTSSFSLYAIVALPEAVATVTVSATDPTVEIGNTRQLAATARAESGNTVPASFTWSSSDAGIATVSEAGVVTGVAVGTATITATTGAVSGTLVLTVRAKDLNRIVDSIRAAHGVPGLVGAIVTRDGGVIAMGVGGSRRVGGPAATLSDKWHIGSNLKGITGSLAAMAVTRGLITWNTSVASMFPELGAAIRPEYRDVTLRELLSMQGGIRNDPPGSAWAGATARAQRETAAAWGLAATPFGPRGSYYYSNISYVIAGAMIERAMSGVYEDLLLTELGAPVGATQIGFGPAAAAGASNQPVGHSWQNQWVACEACDNPPGLSAAGRAHMSIGDWGRIVHELLKADANLSPLISQPNARTIFTGAVSSGGGDQYGLGWVMTTRPWGGRTAYHSGSNTTNHSVAWVGLDTGVGLLAATNAADLNGGRTAAALDALVSRMLTYHQTGN